MKTLRTTIVWKDKIRKVQGVNIHFQDMYGKEVAVFDRYDLIKLFKDIKK